LICSITITTKNNVKNTIETQINVLSIVLINLS